MSPAVQPIRNTNLKDNKYSENDALHALYDELAKGIQSMKNSEVYTVEEAWEEIDKI